jgi:hypothetical protein
MLSTTRDALMHLGFDIRVPPQSSTPNLQGHGLHQGWVVINYCNKASLVFS